MIYIHPIDEETTLIPMLSTTWGNAAYNVSLINTKNTYAPYRVGLKPLASPGKSALGNRSCTHDNWQGSIIDVPDGCVDVEWMSTAYNSHYPTTQHYKEYRYKPNAASTSYQRVHAQMLTGSSGDFPLPDYIWISYDFFPKTYSIKGTLSWKWLRPNCVEVCIRTSRDYVKESGCFRSIKRYKYVWDGAVRVGTTRRVYYASVTVVGRDWPVYLGTYSLQSSGLCPGYQFTGYEFARERLQIGKADLIDASKRICETLPTLDENLKGDLCLTAVQDAKKLEINSIAFVKELFELKSSLTKLYSLLRGKISSKTLGSLWLSLKYGLRLTVIDTKEIIKATQREMNKWDKPYNYVRAMSLSTVNQDSGVCKGLVCTCEYHYKIYYDPVDPEFKSLIQKLIDWDLFPTFQNIWDLIPFSFVIDWFVDFESYFNQVDNAWYATKLDVLETIWSTKYTYKQVPLSILGIYGTAVGRSLFSDVSYTRYDRDVKYYLEIPNLQLDVATEFHNSVELTALVLANRK
jgi:hypothetical protein